MKSRTLFAAFIVIAVSHLFGQTTMNIHQSDGTVTEIPINTIDSITYTLSIPATISTLPAGNITSTSVESGGAISNDGGTPVTQRGVCWSINPNPTTADNVTNDGSGPGSYTSTINGLTDNTTYYARAYAINSAGTAYGDEINFTTTSGGGSIVSNPGAGVTFDGYTYPSIVLGNGQEWMAENLRTTVYANGDPIPNVTDNNDWSDLTTGAWSYYNHDVQYQEPAGKLYNYYTAIDARNVCPSGWHVPSDSEWTALVDYLGGESVAGGKVKVTGTDDWLTPNTDATNEIGFSAVGSGRRSNTDGTFNQYSRTCIFWSTTEYLTYYGKSRFLSYDNAEFQDSNHYKNMGISIRCLKD